MSYNRLEDLSWKEFEELVKFYLKEKIGEGIASFGGTRDKGRDAIFDGRANEFPSRTNPYEGKWIFQAKHRITRGKTIKSVENELIRSLEIELDKIFMKHEFQCDIYIYITNLDTTNTFRENAEEKFNKFCHKNSIKGVKFGVLEYKDFDVFITNRSDVRFRFPALVNFGDLEKIFLKKQEIKNKGFLKSAQKRIHNFVATKHYIEAATRISQDNVLMLVGNPKSGKTSIVEALSLAFLEGGEYKPYFIRNTDEFFEYQGFLPDNESALFICDDIFGRHELEENKLQDWKDYFQHVMGSIKNNRKFIFTARQYIYKEFSRKSGLEEFFPQEDDPSRYVVKLNELLEDEREQILEKHLAHSSLPEIIIEKVNDSKSEILRCKDFSPEVIRSLVVILESLFRKDKAEKINEEISRHIACPDQYLYDFYNNIKIQKKILLISIATSVTAKNEDIEEKYFRLLRDSNEKNELLFHSFIEELDESIIQQREYLNSNEIDYYHPSMFDVIIGVASKDAYYRRLLLKNINLEVLILTALENISSDSLKIKLSPRDLPYLTEGIERYLCESKQLRDSTGVFGWIKSAEIKSFLDPELSPLFKELKKTAKIKISTQKFFSLHSTEPIGSWIRFFEKLGIMISGSKIDFLDQLEPMHRNYQKFDYWKLLFLMEISRRGFINETLEQQRIEEFSEKLKYVGFRLRKGINISPNDGKPKTDEIWLPAFREMDDLISKMKSTDVGRRIYNTQLLKDWEEVKKYSYFAKNRHSGMIKVGHWGAYRKLSEFTDLEGKL